MELKDRVVVITGATGGVGRVAAAAFAGLGARLALVGSDQGRLDRLLGDILKVPGADPGRILAQPADLRDPAASRAAAQAVQQRFGQINVLLHLVGGWLGGKAIVDSDSADLASMLEQHVWTTWHA